MALKSLKKVLNFLNRELPESWVGLCLYRLNQFDMEIYTCNAGKNTVYYHFPVVQIKILLSQTRINKYLYFEADDNPGIYNSVLLLLNCLCLLIPLLLQFL